jgi:hypothetical protein
VFRKDASVQKDLDAGGRSSPIKAGGYPGLFYGAPGMALFRYTWWWPDDLVVKVHYRPGKGND